ncbi:PhoX family protein [Gloeobacter morelensis]|uniref:DUF839 domain-containing protein n=1 Tax=Gloeobacter morelensis MG652769 TaxID=2781736 RepID=A0ABY3PT71_9CYAN|nr:alkaline phosphatase PhoX [Gloeobacter morelensis]UFP96837.1 DUF839 domain-containing protein [Gloeobacter morelensis MG652769]
MSEYSRRELLKFLGVTGGAALLGSMIPGQATARPGSFLGTGPLTPVRLPHALPIYATQKSYLPAAGKTAYYGQPLTSYTVLDDVVVAPEFERYVIVRWGDRVFPNNADYFGYNCDFTAYRPINGNREGYLWVNHEYVSSPISFATPEAPSALAGASPRIATSYPQVVSGTPEAPGAALEDAPQLVRWGEFQYNQGGSVVRIKKGTTGRFAPVADSANRRYHGLSGLAINATRTDVRADGTPYSAVTSWKGEVSGVSLGQDGDNNYLIGTGPAATQVFNLSTDGLGNKIIGTAFNCSGGYTPWGTILTAEENFQAGVGAFFVGVNEAVQPDGTQLGYLVGDPATFVDPFTNTEYLNYTTGTYFGQVGEKYGWMVEIDPADPNWRARKHTWLGRFRHENIAFRAEVGKKLVAYMGDDRRGGNTWKFVSKGRVRDLADRDANSKLLEEGTLYAARYNPDGTGRWIPLVLAAPVNPIAPTVLGEGEAAGKGITPAEVASKLRLPSRAGIAGGTVDGGFYDVLPATEVTDLESYITKGGTVERARLKDYYTTQGAVLCDCYAAANLAGATPTARPEDLEVNPRNPREVFIAYTDGAPGSDGYPDSRIFVVGKYTSDINDTQGFGGLYKIVESSADSTGVTFRWENFKQSGEAGAEGGAGYANVDNLAFDQDGNIWGVTDMSTSNHNGLGLSYATGANGQPLQPAFNTIDHTGTSSALTGVFGCNWIFYIPLSGPEAGQVVPFGYGPPRCECTGPTFVGDTFIVAVQHPGEDSPINGDPNAGGAEASVVTRDIEILDLKGGLFNQTRTIPRGSSFPSNLPTADGGSGLQFGPPRPSVVAIRRKP